MYNFFQKSDEIIINCAESVITSTSIPDLFFGPANNFIGENFVTNVLYNLGFQITNVLELVFYDTSNKDPFWYTVFYRIGDFFIRFIYRDESLDGVDYLFMD